MDPAVKQLHDENVRRLERIDTAIDKAKDDINGVVASQARIEGNVETIKAIVEEQNDRTRNELTVLFGRTRDHGTAIQSIQLDYVPKREFEKHQEDAQDEHVEFDKQIKALTVTLAKYGSVLLVLQFLLGLAVQWFKK